MLKEIFSKVYIPEEVFKEVVETCNFNPVPIFRPEKMLVDLAKKSLFGKAKARPDFLPISAQGNFG